MYLNKKLFLHIFTWPRMRQLLRNCWIIWTDLVERDHISRRNWFFSYQDGTTRTHALWFVYILLSIIYPTSILKKNLLFSPRPKPHAAKCIVCRRHLRILLGARHPAELCRWRRFSIISNPANHMSQRLLRHLRYCIRHHVHSGGGLSLQIFVSLVQWQRF